MDPLLRAWHELGLVARIVPLVRAIAGTALLLTATLYYCFDSSLARVLVLACTAILIWTVGIIEWLGRHKSYSAKNLATFISTIFVGQTAVIFVTGGIESPFIILYLPPTVALAVGSGTSRPYFLAVSAPLLATAAFLALYLGGHDLMPPLQRFWSAAYPSSYFAAVALIVVLGIAVGSFIGLRIRIALDRALLATAEARQELLDTMTDRNRELNALLGALAHELKNPLSAIQGLSGLVQRKLPAESKEAERMAVLVGEVRRMGSIIEEFLTLSRPLQNLDVRTIRLRELLETVLNLHEAKTAGLHLHCDVDASLALEGDQRKLEQVFVNLLQNAIDATPPGGMIRILAGVQDESIAVTIEDSGSGLAESVRGRLFVAGVTSKTAGSGLGLTIARAIVEQHHGQLSLDDREGGGICARVLLPLQQRSDDAGLVRPELQE
ncbi:MAG: HAMP domain-containing sensor histidine kinase [Myxococcota bacterium]|jgi:signal transduction histidine kinase|nr:HAMP domain-containing sensor histidine kinase [Myxococcota bacterium]